MREDEALAHIPPAYRQCVERRPARLELWGWCALAVGALAVSGLYAVLMIFARAPGSEERFPWLLGFFHKGLVIHVVFSFVIWFLAVMGALFHVVTARLAPLEMRGRELGPLGLTLSLLSFPLLFGPALAPTAEASLNNYVPVLIHPAYYAGLLLLGAGVACAAIRLLLNAWGAMGRDVFGAIVSYAAVVYLSALLCVAAAFLHLRGAPLTASFNESLFWGGGHVLQFANTLLLVATWYLLAALAYGRTLVSRTLVGLGALPLLFAALAAPLFYLHFTPFSLAQREAFTNLQYVFGPPTSFLAIALVIGVAQAGRWSSSRGNAVLALFLSIGLFGVGGGLGLFIDGTDTRTPGHYHGVIGGITLAFMALFYELLLPLLRRPVRRRRLVSAQLVVYAVGQLAQCIGLFLAAAPRKVAALDKSLLSTEQVIGLQLNHAGGGLAILGGAAFIVLAGSALLRLQGMGRPRGSLPPLDPQPASPGGLRQ